MGDALQAVWRVSPPEGRAGAGTASHAVRAPPVMAAVPVAQPEHTGSNVQNYNISNVLPALVSGSGAGVSAQAAEEMRRKVALIAADHMAPYTTAPRGKPGRCRAQGGWCGYHLQLPQLPGSKTPREHHGEAGNTATQAQPAWPWPCLIPHREPLYCPWVTQNEFSWYLLKPARGRQCSGRWAKLPP